MNHIAGDWQQGSDAFAVGHNGFAFRHSREGGNPGLVWLDKQFYVYMLASQRNGTLYTGVTSNMIRRTWQHKQSLIEGFTTKYGVNTNALSNK